MIYIHSNKLTNKYFLKLNNLESELANLIEKKDIKIKRFKIQYVEFSKLNSFECMRKL